MRVLHFDTFPTILVQTLPPNNQICGYMTVEHEHPTINK